MWTELQVAIAAEVKALEELEKVEKVVDEAKEVRNAARQAVQQAISERRAKEMQLIAANRQD
mgnify:FL=1